MGGGSGGIIVRNSVMEGLGDPIVSGQLPAKIKATTAMVFVKDPSTWSAQDCKDIAHAVTWALCNLA